MTLLEVIGRIEDVAKSQPSVNMIVRSDVFRISSAPERRYGIFSWTQMQHSGEMSDDLITYRFSLFYVDRLMENRQNEVEIQSVGIQTLDNIVRQLDDIGISAESWTFRTFTQRFLDECAGVWCEVGFQVPVSLVCAEDYGDYSIDFSNDFLIF